MACPVGEDGRPRAEHGQRPAELLADLAEQGDPIYRKYHSLEDDIHIQTRHKRPTGNKKGGISAAIFYASDTLSKHDSVHLFCQIERLPITLPQMLPALVAVVLGLHLFPDTPIGQFISVRMQKGRHLRPTMCADDDAGQ